MRTRSEQIKTFEVSFLGRSKKWWWYASTTSTDEFAIRLWIKDNSKYPRNRDYHLVNKHGYRKSPFFTGRLIKLKMSICVSISFTFKGSMRFSNIDPFLSTKHLSPGDSSRADSKEQVLRGDGAVPMWCSLHPCEKQIKKDFFKPYITHSINPRYVCLNRKPIFLSLLQACFCLRMCVYLYNSIYICIIYIYIYVFVWSKQNAY